jgi:antitoxin (DNA-binding transcriptional repressor) of toxin-antitoxin stability system
MKTVGVRALKDGLSGYLREVKRGNIIRISDRSVVVAELRSPAADDGADSAYERLVRDGKVLPPVRRWPKDVLAAPRRRPLPAGTALDLVAEDRTERW